MKNFMLPLLIFNCLFGFSQVSTPENKALKQKILKSKELQDWQHAQLAFQKRNHEFCELKYKQKINQRLTVACGNRSNNNVDQEFFLKLFRTLRVTNELKDSVTLKEKVLRLKYPEIVTHFNFDDIFPEIYMPIQEAQKTIFK